MKQDDNGVLQWYNPTEGKGNSAGNIVDPQSWISASEEETGVDTSTEAVRDGDGNKIGTATKYENNGKNQSGWTNFVNNLLNALNDPRAWGINR